MLASSTTDLRSFELQLSAGRKSVKLASFSFTTPTDIAIRNTTFSDRVDMAHGAADASGPSSMRLPITIPRKPRRRRRFFKEHSPLEDELIVPFEPLASLGFWENDGHIAGAGGSKGSWRLRLRTRHFRGDTEASNDDRDDAALEWTLRLCRRGADDDDDDGDDIIN